MVEAIGAEAKSRFTGRIPKVTIEVKPMAPPAKEIKRSVQAMQLPSPREQRILASLERATSEKEAVTKSLRAHRETLAGLATRHGSTREEFEQLFDGINDDFDRMGKAYVDTRMVLREELSRAQWQALFAP